MPIDPLGRVRRSWQSVTDAHSKVEKHRSGDAKKGGVQVGRSGAPATISRSLALQLKQEISSLDLDDLSDQERAVEKFVVVVLADELGLQDRSGSDFHELVDRVVDALSDGGARPDLLKALATLSLR